MSPERRKTAKPGEAKKKPPEVIFRRLLSVIAVLESLIPIVLVLVLILERSDFRR